MNALLNDRIKALNEAFKNLNSIKEISDLVLSTVNNGRSIFTMGNGGSSSQGQHLSAELLGRFSKNRYPISCLDLSSNASTLTCISNDFGFEYVFSRQLSALLKPGDLVFAFSTSGESLNILKAVEIALIRKATVVAITSSRKSSMLHQCATISLGVDTLDVAIIQEMTLLFIHLICTEVDSAIFLSS